MLHKHRTDSRIFAKSLQNRTDFKSGFFKLTDPGIRGISSHIIVCMITRHDHKRCHIDLGWLESRYLFDKILDRWFCFHCSDKDVGVS